MSTSGVICFMVDGRVLSMHVRSDAFPDVLGRYVLDALVGTTVDKLRSIARAVNVVKPYTTVPLKDVDYYTTFGHLDPTQRYNWLQLFGEIRLERLVHGVLDGSVHTMVHLKDYLRSQFCFYGYVVNLDDEVLEFHICGQIVSATPLRLLVNANTTKFEYPFIMADDDSSYGSDF